MNTYIAYYNQKEHVVYAETSYAAQQVAIGYFSPPKSKRHMVHVHLAVKDGVEVTHTATE